jgi:alkylation response protein AidB-like acyl-CoA dehydrogenase
MGSYGMTEETLALRARMRAFVDGEVFEVEAALDHGTDAGPGSAAHAEAMALMADLKAEPKRRGLWAPGHPVEIGGGLPSLIEFWGAQMLPNVIDRAIQVHGALGVTADTPLDKRCREARYARI